ncbi:MAG: ABC transporter permease [Thermomicrobiales bacterium]|nr:ABC transporter permease [Thermomicrobiales bacterium]
MSERQSWWRGAISPIVSSTIAVLAALIVGGIVIAATGSDPIEAYRAMFRGAFGSRRQIGETLVSATPLILGGLAFAIAARAGMFNIGIEGQLVMGAFAAGVIGTYDLGPRPVGLVIALAAGVIAGGIWGMIPGLLKAFSGAHEVITTIMLNYLALRMVSYAVNNVDWLPVNPPLQATDPVLPANKLPILLDGTRLHAGIIVAIVAAIVLWWILFRSVYGYKVRTVGLSPGAAKFSGIPWKRTIVIAMVLSGIFAGLGGASETLGLQGRFYNVSPGYGFTAIAVGLVGRNHPIGVIAAGLLFGVLRAGATQMQNSADVSKEIVQVLQGLVILAVAASAYVAMMRQRRAAAKAAVSSAPEQGVEA